MRSNRRLHTLIHAYDAMDRRETDAKGKTSRCSVGSAAAQLYGVDPWATYRSDAEQSRPDHVQQISDTQTLHWGLPIALRTLGVNARRWHPIRLPSVKAARCFEDGELDFVFIDGEHSYEAAKADIEAW